VQTIARSLNNPDDRKLLNLLCFCENLWQKLFFVTQL